MAAPAVTDTLELDQIQGLVLRGYGKLAARFLLLHVDKPEPARAYLRDLSGRIDHGKKPSGHCALQVAFTAAGLEALEVPQSALDTFQREFLEGMADPVRATSLGDDPSGWAWGRDATVHVLLMIYAHEKELEDRVKSELAAAHGMHLVREQLTSALKDQKEHFGFRDGLSMPVFAGVPKEPGRGKAQEWWTKTPLAPGEFVLGYKNEYECLTESPTADPADDPANHLPALTGGRKDLGKNGTYLVYREMTQEVHKFWNYLADESREPGADRVEQAVALGAKMVGRWPGGAPLITSPERDAGDHATDNKFTYKDDEAGLRCPVGAHIRRASPRDVLGSGRDTEDSTIMVRKHQMIRRGRPFGPPVAKSMEPREILAAKPDDVARGLHFICIVGHITRQFEFVQRSWITSANFGALFKDGDPIAAARRPANSANPNNEFTCPASPVRRKYKAMPQFTHVVGGAYFFLPGIAALKFIARLP